MEDSLPKGGRYEYDFVLWADGQAALLRSGRVQHLDLPALADEIEALAARERSSVNSQVRRIYVHLLKFSIQPEEATWDWKDSITDVVDELSDLFDISRSLEGTMQECRPKQYNARAGPLRTTRACRSTYSHRQRRKKLNDGSTWPLEVTTLVSTRSLKAAILRRGGA